MRTLRFVAALLLFAQLPYATRAQDENADRLTRAVKYWQDGNAKAAYLSLDSISNQPFTTENAIYKIRASIWTATYLQAQYKVKTAAPFLDSAATWATQSGITDEMKRAYEANLKYYQSTGNARMAQSWQQTLNNLRDSLDALAQQAQLDSMNAAIALTQKATSDSVAVARKEADEAKQQLSSARMMAWMFGLLSALLFAVVIWKNNKKKSPTPTSAQVATPRTAAPAPTPKPAAPATTVITEVPVQETVKPKDAAKDHHQLTARISAVELVLIQADTLAWKMNGDGKATHKILQRYVDDFSGLTKTIDDAIASNQASAILNALDLLRPYFDVFGMSGTSKWIDELREEGDDAKVNKMLSRVFQVRNHARRALDEAKAILEKVNL